MGTHTHNGDFADPQHQSSQDSQFLSPEELITFAQGYFVSDFPNSERLDCPVKGKLSSLVLSSTVPDDHLRSHIFGCSECFREYHEALAANRAEAKQVVPAEINSWWKTLLAGISRQPVPVFAGAFSLVLLVLGGAYVWRTYLTAPAEIVARRDSAPVPGQSERPANNNLLAANSGESPSPLSAVEPATAQTTEQQTSQQRKPLLRPAERTSTEDELLAMSIDLGNYTLTRGGAGNGRDVKVPRARTRLLLTLPEGSARGFYTVSVIGVPGNARVVNRAHSADGKTVGTTLDMKGLTPQKYTLRIYHEGEPPIDVPIMVTAEKTASPFKRR